MNENDTQMEWPGSTRRVGLEPPNPDPDYEYYSNEPVPWEMLKHALWSVSYGDDRQEDEPLER